MMNRIRAMLILMLTIMGIGCGSGGCAGREISINGESLNVYGDNLYKGSADVTVALVIRNDTGDVRSYCTGVWVSEIEIMTAAHCVESEFEELFGKSPVGDKVHYIIEREVVGVGREPSAIHLGVVKYYDKSHDIAVVEAVYSGIPSHKWAEFSKEVPKIGDDVHMVGHPKGLYWTLSKGVVSGFREHDEIGGVIQIEGVIWYGNSGGGVFDKEGRLFGICSMMSGVPFMSYYIKLDVIVEALEKSRLEE